MFKRLGVALLAAVALMLTVPAAANADAANDNQEHGPLVALLIALGFDVEVVDLKLDANVDGKVEADVDTDTDARIDVEAGVRAGAGA